MISAARATLDVKGLLGLAVRRPGDDVERDRGAEGVDEIARGGGVVEILDDDRQVVDRERDRSAEQEQQNQRQQQRQREREAVADDLGQLLAGLRENASHDASPRRLAQLCPAGAPFRRRDEDVFEREASLRTTSDDLDAVRLAASAMVARLPASADRRR